MVVVGTPAVQLPALLKLASTAPVHHVPASCPATTMVPCPSIHGTTSPVPPPDPVYVPGATGTPSTLSLFTLWDRPSFSTKRAEDDSFTTAALSAMKAAVQLVAKKRAFS